MDVSSILFHQDLAGTLITIAGQSILVSLVGIAVIKLISGKSAPVRSLACVAVMLAMGLAATLSIGFRLTGISWSQATIPVSMKSGAADNANSLKRDRHSSSISGNPVTPSWTARAEEQGVLPSIPPPAAHSGLFTLPAFFFINSLGAVWLTGVLFQLFRLGYGVLKVKNFRRTLKNEGDLPFDDMLRTVAATFRKNRLPALYSSPRIDSPITIGLLKPVVIIPEKLIPVLSEHELKSILLHELAHVYHYDQIIGVLKRTVISFFWWNPLIYIINRAHEQSREEVSDNHVLNELPPRVYIQCLMTLAEKVCLISNFPSAAGMAGRRFDLKVRVEKILSMKKNLAIHTGGCLRATTVAVCLVMIFGIAGLHAHIRTEDTGISAGDFYEPPIIPGHSTVAEDEQSVSGNDTAPKAVAALSPNNFEAVSSSTTVGRDEPSGGVRRKSGPPTRDNLKLEKKPKTRTGSAAVQPVEDMVLDNQAETNALPPPKKSIAEKALVSDANISNEINYLKRGVGHLKRGQVEDAIADFTKEIDLRPGKAVAYTARGSAYFRLDQFEEAVADYDRAIEMDPGFAAAYQNRGSVYFHQGQYDKAIQDYNKAIEINPASIASYIDRGIIYQRRERIDEAISDFTRVLELNPEDADTYIHRGAAYHSQEQFRKAFADFDRAIALNPGRVSAYIYRGYYYQTDKEYEKAVTDYSRALILNPNIDVADNLRNEIARMTGKGDSKTEPSDNRREVACQRVSPTGTHFEETICASETEWETASQRGQELVRDIINGSNGS